MNKNEFIDALRLRLADLPCTFDNERHMFGICFPFFQESIDFSAQIQENPSFFETVFESSLQKNEGIFKDFYKKMREYPKNHTKK